jgi:hypothetical protein
MKQVDDARQGFALEGKIRVKDGRIVYRKASYPLAGATANVQAAGDIDKRVTATRLLLTGPLAFGLRKKKDKRELCMLVEGEGFGFVVELNPKRLKAAQQFAVKLSAEGRSLVSTTSTDRVSQLQQLDQLRQSGALTLDEFEAEKRRLLAAP